MAVMSCECDALEHAIRVVEVEAAASGTKKANRPSFVPARIAVERSSIVPLQEQATHLVYIATAGGAFTHPLTSTKSFGWDYLASHGGQ
jgi:hypothetical protein